MTKIYTCNTFKEVRLQLGWSETWSQCNDDEFQSIRYAMMLDDEYCLSEEATINNGNYLLIDNIEGDTWHLENSTKKLEEVISALNDCVNFEHFLDKYTDEFQIREV
jgi:hypothetical protein